TRPDGRAARCGSAAGGRRAPRCRMLRHAVCARSPDHPLPHRDVVYSESNIMSELAGLPTTTTPVRQRVAYLDNARYWVMILVVVGHFLTRLLDMDSARGTYTWIYSFHMPFFILISGYTARRYMGDFRQIKRMVSTLIIPYLIVETAL